jgi:hypothetical protein
MCQVQIFSYSFFSYKFRQSQGYVFCYFICSIYVTLEEISRPVELCVDQKPGLGIITTHCQLAKDTTPQSIQVPTCAIQALYCSVFILGIVCKWP